MTKQANINNISQDFIVEEAESLMQKRNIADAV